MAESTRCPTCRKHVAETVWGLYFNVTPSWWDNWLSREVAGRMAKDGVCPWCGRRTTTPVRTLLGRFEPNLRRHDRGVN